MKKNKNLLIVTYLFFLFLFISFSVAQQSFLGTFKKDSCIKVIQLCSGCSYVNITSITYDGYDLVKNVSMQKNGAEFNYTFCNTSGIGTYTVNGIGDPDGTPSVFAYDFEVTPTGKSFNSSKAISYSLIIIILLIVFFVLMGFGIYLPSGNKRNEMTGYIIAVNNIKYLKYVFIGFAYLTAVVIMFFFYQFAYAYLDFMFMVNIFRFIFLAMVVSILPLFILFSYIIIANLVKDSKIKDALTRGLRIR